MMRRRLGIHELDLVRKVAAPEVRAEFPAHFCHPVRPVQANIMIHSTNFKNEMVIADIHVAWELDAGDAVVEGIVDLRLVCTRNHGRVRRCG